MGFDDAEQMREDLEEGRFHYLPPSKDDEDSQDQTDDNHRPAEGRQVEERVGPVVDVIPPRPSKVPCPQLETDDDARERDGVVEAGAVVCRLGVDAHKDQDGDGEEDGREVVACVQPELEGRAVVELNVGDGGTHDGADYHVDEAVHAAV